jgi:hypothetical protein
VLTENVHVQQTGIRATDMRKHGSNFTEADVHLTNPYPIFTDRSRNHLIGIDQGRTDDA